MTWLRERAGLLALWLSIACGDDPRATANAPPGSADSEPDAAVRGDGASTVPPGAVSFEVPAGGGTTRVAALDGMAIAFTFPASAAGTQITLTPLAASAIGWPDRQFAEVIRMEPDGLQFEHPVLVQPASGELIVLEFASGGAKSRAQGLPLNLAGDGFLLAHFSTLALVPAASSCDQHSGWVASDPAASAKRCSDRKFPTYVSFNCTANAYCLEIEAQCCAADKADACHLGDRQLAVSYQPAAFDERYSHCRESADAGHLGDPSSGGATGEAGAPATDSGGSGGAGGDGDLSGEALGGAGSVESGGSGGAGGEPAAGSGGGEAGESGGTAGEEAGGSGGTAGEPAAGSGGEELAGSGGARGEAGDSGAAGESAAGSGGDAAAGSGGDAAAGSGGDAAAGSGGDDAAWSGGLE